MTTERRRIILSRRRPSVLTVDLVLRIAGVTLHRLIIVFVSCFPSSQRTRFIVCIYMFISSGLDHVQLYSTPNTYINIICSESFINIFYSKHIYIYLQVWVMYSWILLKTRISHVPPVTYILKLRKTCFTVIRPSVLSWTLVVVTSKTDIIYGQMQPGDTVIHEEHWFKRSNISSPKITSNNVHS